MEYTAGRGTTALGIIGTVLGGTALVNNGNGGGLLGNILGGNNPVVVDDKSMPVNRYDMDLIRDNMAKDGEIALLKANTFTDQKFADLNDRYNERFRNIESQIAAQAVHNAKTEGSFALVHADIKSVHDELKSDIKLEAERRCCSDNALADYMNATFYTKMVADVTTGTETTAQTTYNPVRNCGCCK